MAFIMHQKVQIPILLNCQLFYAYPVADVGTIPRIIFLLTIKKNTRSPYRDLVFFTHNFIRASEANSYTDMSKDSTRIQWEYSKNTHRCNAGDELKGKQD